MKTGCAPVGVVAVLAAAALALAGCGAGLDDGYSAGVGSCYGPMICGAGYAVPVYYHPYIAYMRDPVHYSININNGRTTTIYRPPTAYAPRPVPAAKAPAPPAARPAAPRPAAPVRVATRK